MSKPKREIRISFFYADKANYEKFNAKNNFNETLKQANDFYGKYKLRLDPFPFPYNEKLYREAFILATGQGTVSDMRMGELTRGMRFDKSEADALHERRAAPGVTSAEILQIDQQLKANWARAQDRLWEGGNSTREYEFRIHIAHKLTNDQTLKKYTAEYRRHPRLAIVLCKFYPSAVAQKIEGADTAGQYIGPLDRTKKELYRHFKRPIPTFANSFVIIDIEHADWHALAHEIAHGNGHVHPVEGGDFDGSEFSIYNYMSQVREPSVVILEAADLKSLENAYFVRE